MSAQRTASGVAPATTERSLLGTIALTLTAVSFVGFLILVVGSVLDWRGFSDDPNDNSAVADIVWSTFALGGILALISGIIAWVRGRSRGVVGDVRAGRIAVGWFVLAFLISLIWSAFE